MKALTPLVSIIISLFNKENYIAATLDSLLNQDYENIEILIIDDMSTDSSFEIALSYAKENQRIFAKQRPENAGTAVCRNEGMHNARGAFIFLIDADDLATPWAISTLVSHIADIKSNAGFCFGQIVSVDENEILIPKPNLNQDLNVNSIENWITRNIVGCGSGVLFYRSLLDIAGNFDESLRPKGAEGCDDWMFFLSLRRHCTFSMVPETTIGYREAPGAQSQDVRRMWSSYTELIQRARHWFPQIETLYFKLSKTQISAGYGEVAWGQKKYTLSILMWIRSLYYKPGFAIRKLHRNFLDSRIKQKPSYHQQMSFNHYCDSVLAAKKGK